MHRVLLILSILLFVGCSQETCRETVDAVPIQLEIQRIDKELFQTQSAIQIEELLDKYPAFSKLFLDADQYPNNAVLAESIFNLIQNPSIDTLYQESLDAFQDIDQLMEELGEAFGKLSVYYPATRIPVVQTAVTGLYKDLIISNEQIIIGMDFFIGPDASYPPQQIPEYILNRYDTKHLPSNIMQFISSQYIQQSKGESMLAEMIDHGKSYYLLSKILPCTPENILIGYTDQEWEDALENDAIIWANFIENELLYSTDHQMKQKFLGERPNVYEISERCPGRIGRWLGWQIVKSYVEKTGASVQTLMEEPDANKVFRLSGYKPSGS